MKNTKNNRAFNKTNNNCATTTKYQLFRSLTHTKNTHSITHIPQRNTSNRMGNENMLHIFNSIRMFANRYSYFWTLTMCHNIISVSASYYSSPSAGTFWIDLCK